MFVGLSGVLQGIIILKKDRGDERRRFLLCWHGASSQGTCTSKAKGSSWMRFASDSEVLRKEKMRGRAFGESPIIARFKIGVREVKGLSLP
jgi:hypothetical protein